MAKVKIARFPPDYDVVPQAIFWRKLEYFTMAIRQDEDGLDEFKAASFTIGNDIQFDLRTYAGHPQFTVTLYLPKPQDANGDSGEISRIIRIVTREMLIPKSALAWQRGDPMPLDGLMRPKADRLREAEARTLALKIAAQCPNRTASTSLLKREVPNYTDLSKIDLQKSITRGNESTWQQIVGNVISHQDSPQGPFVKGYATRTADGLSVTEKGIAYLNNIGFLEVSTALSAKRAL
jgi:hypothetical protein